MAGLLVCLILAWVTVEDLIRFRIRNVAVALLVGCFVLGVVSGSHPVAVLPHLLLASAAFVALLPVFAIGGIGGGDAKLLCAALLWIGPGGLFLFALCLAGATVAYYLGAVLGWLPKRERGRRTAIPFAPGISLAWIATIATAGGWTCAIVPLPSC